MPATFDAISAKIFDWDALQSQVTGWQSDGDRVVFTNGCFDLLHKGHIAYLSEAADMGRRLVIGVNSDDSVTRLKGANRPFQDEAARMSILAALFMVDAVVLFSDDTPLKLIESISPDILVKGGDYAPNEVVGANHVWASGGSVYCVPLTQGYATSRIARKFAR